MAQQENPFGTSGAGANAFRAAYDRLKAEADLARQGIGQNYANAYQQLRNQSFQQGLGASAQPGLSGGQAVGARQAISAQQMGALGTLMQGQEAAMRQQRAMEGSIYSNALLEGQQAQQYQQQQEQYNVQREQQIQSIINDTSLSDEEKKNLLKQFGFTDEEVAARVTPTPQGQTGFQQTLSALQQPFNRPNTFGESFAQGAFRGLSSSGLLGPLAQAYNTAGSLYTGATNLGKSVWDFFTKKNTPSGTNE